MCFDLVAFDDWFVSVTATPASRFYISLGSLKFSICRSKLRVFFLKTFKFKSNNLNFENKRYLEIELTFFLSPTNESFFTKNIQIFNLSLKNMSFFLNLQI